MDQLSKARIGAVRQLIEQAPDAAVRMLETALANGARADDRLKAVQSLVGEEMLDRRTRALVFAPLQALCEPPRDALKRQAFPRGSLSLTWRALRIAAPDEMASALRAFATLRADDALPDVFDLLCRRAAGGVRDDAEPFRPVIEALRAYDPAAPKAFADALSLVPLTRPALAKLPTWLRTQSDDYAAAIRLAFRDATAVGQDSGPLFMEILFSHMAEPHEILRLISLVMDRPSDRYLAASELAFFGERMLDDLDRRVDSVRRFDPTRGLEAGVAEAGSVHQATTIANEFEQWLALNREGPWGARLVAARRGLATAVEARLREVEPAVAAALPVQGPRKGRGFPRLTDDPDPNAVVKAQALLGFLCESRSSAATGGFGSMRAKVVEALDPRIDTYAEDLLEQLHHSGGASVERVRAYLAIAAEFLGLVRDPKAAEIVRRRTAVA